MDTPQTGVCAIYLHADGLDGRADTLPDAATGPGRTTTHAHWARTPLGARQALRWVAARLSVPYRSDRELRAEIERLRTKVLHLQAELRHLGAELAQRPPPDTLAPAPALPALPEPAPPPRRLPGRPGRAHLRLVPP